MNVIIPIILTIFLLIPRISAQSTLNRDFFTQPKAVSLQKFVGNDIGDLLLDSSGIGLIWDCRNIELEQLDVFYEFQQYQDSNPAFSNSAFSLNAREGGNTSSAFELYALTEGAVLFRGIGTINEQGIKQTHIFDEPFQSLRFPWLLGETFYGEHPFRSSTKTLQAIGTLLLPSSSAKSAYKFTERYSEGNLSYVEHTWFTTGLPYPILTIRDEYYLPDSSLLMRTVDFLQQHNSMSLDNDNYENHAITPFFTNNTLNIPTGYLLKDIFNLHGAKVSYSELSSGQYSVQHSSQTLFIVYLDATQKILSHIIPVIQ